MAAFRTCLWSPRCQPWLTPAPGAHIGSAVLPVSMQRKKLLWWAHPSPLMPPNNGPLPLVGPGFFPDSLSCGALYPNPLRLCSHSQPQSSPRGLTSKAQASVPSPDLPQRASGQASQAGECRSASTCTGLSLLCPPHTCCCALLQGSEATPLSPPMDRGTEGTSQCAETFPFSQLPPRGAGPFPIPFCLFFFCPAQLHGDFLALLEVWSLPPAFSRRSVRVIPHVDVFLMYLWGEGELYVLLLRHVDPVPRAFIF